MAKLASRKADLERTARNLIAARIDCRYIALKYSDLISGSASDDDIINFYLENVGIWALDPHREFSESFYLETYRDVSRAVKAGQLLCGYHHYLAHGEGEGRSPYDTASRGQIGLGNPNSADQIQDASRLQPALKYLVPKLYIEQVRARTGLILDPEDAPRHFLERGILEGYVPTEDFDEDFYVTYYKDVREAKDRNEIPSGFYHYIVAGAAEGRAPNHDMGTLLTAKLGKLSEPVGLQRLEALSHRLRGVRFLIDPNRPPTLNVFVPSMDPDIMFGGYTALLHFLCRLVESGQRARFLIMEDGQSNREWLLSRISSRERWYKAFSRMEFENVSVAKAPLRVSNDDRCLAYSTWTAHDAWSVSKHLSKKTIAFFVQEYEPIFHDNDSFRFMVESAYDIPHIGIFNTIILADYFRENKIGVFSNGGSGISLPFEHAIVGAPPADLAAGVRKGPRRLFYYARPEQHASRNIFEIGVIALRMAIERGVFQGDWEFLGFGTLGKEYTVPLAMDRNLIIRTRMPEAEYQKMAQSFDVGLSLMWAPHPSVVPFELAKMGVVTVTNEYGSRTADVLRGFGHNVVPCRGSLEGVVEGLAEAIRRSTDYVARSSVQFDSPSDWDEVFPSSFIESFRSTFAATG